MRTSYIKIVLAIFGFAVVFFLSCADAPIMEFPSVYEVQGVASSSSSEAVVSSSSLVVGGSSSVVASSSSTTPSSSSLVPSSSSRASSSSEPSSSSIQSSIFHGGETYETVVIGTQTWFKRNLNYNVSGSKCYDNSTANCTKYGRLYNWATAKTACPSGWHVPSYDEWLMLKSYIETDKGCTSCDAKHLKATSGWYNEGDGLDSYGFFAMPGGNGDSDGSFDGVGDYGVWWCAREDDSSIAYGWIMFYDYDDADGLSYSVSSLYSVRCLKND